MATDRETTIGALLTPAVKAVLGGSYFVDLTAQPLAIAETPAELEGELKAS
jgi:hypothetical protein